VNLIFFFGKEMLSYADELRKGKELVVIVCKEDFRKLHSQKSHVGYLCKHMISQLAENYNLQDAR
jgi:hypothetical protein